MCQSGERWRYHQCECWDTKLEFTHNYPIYKRSHINGAGRTNTIITCSGDCFDLTSGGGSSSRISNFRLNPGGAFVNLWGVNGDKTIIIDNNYLYKSSSYDWEIRGYDVLPVTNYKHPTVIIANNIIYNTRIYNVGTNWRLNDGRNYQGVLWTQTTTWGDHQYVNYIEGNEFHGGGGGYSTVDANWGGRFVFRFNTLIGASVNIEEHAIIGDTHRGNQRWEIYNNDSTGSTNYRFALIQGSGSGVMFNNLLSSTMSFADIGNRRSQLNVGGSAGKCDGTNSKGWDGNTAGQNGYPCRDQIGRVKDPSLWSPGSSYGTQTFQPAYIYNNKTPSNKEMTRGTPNYDGSPDYQSTHIRANRDYYIMSGSGSFNGSSGVGMGTYAQMQSNFSSNGCTAGVGYWVTDRGSWNTTGDDGQLWVCNSGETAYEFLYGPYTYPHPLVSSGTQDQPASLSPPSNLRVLP